MTKRGKALWAGGYTKGTANFCPRGTSIFTWTNDSGRKLSSGVATKMRARTVRVVGFKMGSTATTFAV